MDEVKNHFSALRFEWMSGKITFGPFDLNGWAEKSLFSSSI
jgi:hypothetical protein